MSDHDNIPHYLGRTDDGCSIYQGDGPEPDGEYYIDEDGNYIVEEADPGYPQDWSRPI